MSGTAAIVIPSPPPNFTFIPSEFQPGKYIVGHDQFALANFPLTNVFHREQTSVDDLLLGVLSVIVIAILSDITHSVLLRATTNRFSVVGVITALMVDEAAHMRNVASLLRRARKFSRQRFSAAPPRMISVFVLAIVALIFVADVVIVVVTQPRKVLSGPYEYNLRGLQPITTNHNLAKWIHRMSSNRPCIAPAMVNGSVAQSRRYHLNSCHMLRKSTADLKWHWRNPSSAQVTNITSLYHKFGSEHNFSFGTGWRSISTRVQAIKDGSEEAVRYILFDIADDDAMSNAKYLHKLAMARAKEFSCRKKKARELCEDVKVETVPSSQELFDTTTFSTYSRRGEEKIDAKGLKTVFEEPLPLPYHAAGLAMAVFSSSSAVLEVSGKGYYGSSVNRKESHEGDGMLEEESRLGGVVLFVVVTAVALCFMLWLRLWLQPTSISTLAADSMDLSAITLGSPGPLQSNASLRTIERTAACSKGRLRRSGSEGSMNISHCSILFSDRGAAPPLRSGELQRTNTHGSSQQSADLVQKASFL